MVPLAICARALIDVEPILELTSLTLFHTVSDRMLARNSCPLQNKNSRYQKQYQIFTDWIRMLAIAIQNSCQPIHDKLYKDREIIMRAK